MAAFAYKKQANEAIWRDIDLSLKTLMFYKYQLP